MLYNHFHHFIKINDSDCFFLWLFAVVPDEPHSHEQQPLPRRAMISTVTMIAVITAARQSRRFNGPCRGRGGPCRGRGGFADAGRPCWTAWHCQPHRARRLAAAGPLARGSPLARRTTSRRWPAPGRRWPAGLPGSACRLSAAGGQRGLNGALH